MATTIDRPPHKSPAQPAKPPGPPRRPPGSGPLGRSPERNRPRDRWLACLCLFGPGVALILAALAVLATGLAIAFGGAGAEPPATGAARLVPGDALLYVHVSTDPARPAVRQAVALSRRLPVAPLLFAALTTRLDAMLGGHGGDGVNFSADVRPWLGKEAALAVLDTPGPRAGSLLVLDVRAGGRARRFLTGVGAQPGGTYLGVPLVTAPSGATMAFVGHYLVLGQLASVHSAIEVAAGRLPSLAGARGYQRAAETEPAGRVLDAYASADGVRRALVPRAGLLGGLGALVDQPALGATTLSLSAQTSRARIDVHSTLVPKLAAADPPAQFTPTLAGALPAGSMLLMDAKGLRSGASRLLAPSARVGVAAKIGPLLSHLGTALAAQGVDLNQFLAVFSGETVIGVTPGRDGAGPQPVVITRPAQAGQARAVLAGLVGPLTQVFAPPQGAPGQVPEVTDRTVAGVLVHELSLAPGFRLDYAVAHGLVVLSTGPGGVAGVLAHRRSLGDAPGFQSTVGDHPSEVTSLVFFDLSQLLRLGEPTGLIDSTRQATLWPSLEKIRAVGLMSWRGDSETTTQLQFQIP